MLINIFDSILQMSVYGLLAACFAAVFCLLLRYLPCSRKVGFWFWAIVAIRLVCPFTLPLSDWMYDGPLGQIVEQNVITSEIIEDVSVLSAGDITREAQGNTEGVHASVNYVIAVHAFAGIWAVGVLCFWGYGLISALRFRRKLRFAMKVEEGVYEVDTIPSSCITGIFRPRIYLVPNLGEEQEKFIICHEKEHIRNHDHIWKLAAYAIMSLHWFNIPLWGFYRMFLNEMERYCDERVVRVLGEERKEDYCEILLEMSVQKGRFVFSPLAFGEKRGKNDMKDRIKQILKYKKPRKGVQPAILAAGVVCAVGLLSGGEVHSTAEEASSIAIIGGADGPTSIFIAGKLGGGEEDGQPEYEIPEFLANTFLQSYFTVGHEDAEEVLAAYEREALDAAAQAAEDAISAYEKEAQELQAAYEGEIQKNLESEAESEAAGLYQWDSEVLSGILNEGMYLFLTEEAKERMLANRYLLRAYQLAAELEEDLSVDGYEMTVAYEEEEEAGYEYSMTVKAGDELYSAQGDIRVISDEELGWRIDAFTVTFK